MPRTTSTTLAAPQATKIVRTDRTERPMPPTVAQLETAYLQACKRLKSAHEGYGLHSKDDMDRLEARKLRALIAWKTARLTEVANSI